MESAAVRPSPCRMHSFAERGLATSVPLRRGHGSGREAELYFATVECCIGERWCSVGKLAEI